MASASAPALDDILQCPICLDILYDPKVLDCQHTFCGNCLKVHYISSSTRHGTTNSVDCPTCRLRTNLINNSIDSLPGNYIVSDIIERQYGRRTMQRPPGYAQQIEDRLEQLRKDEKAQDTFSQYLKPAVAALFGILGGLLLAKGVSKVYKNEKK